MEKIDLMMRLLRESEETRWVAEQVAASFAQGISMNVKEAMKSDIGFFELQPPGLTRGEQKKREKYETTRPYTDAEKAELIASALNTVYGDLPAIQLVGIRLLRELGAGAVNLEFMPPGELEQAQPSYSRSLSEIEIRHSHLQQKLEDFLQKFSS